MRSFSAVLFASLALLGGNPWPASAQMGPPSPGQLREHLELLQDLAAGEVSPPPAPRRGLVPISESNTRYTNTFINAIAVFALTRAGAPVRAQLILDVLARQMDTCPGCACQGGLQKERLIPTGRPDPAAARNDFFVGENAWLLAAARYYQSRTGDQRYQAFIQRLESWLECLEALTPNPGIYGGYDKNGDLLPPHAEGSIDVYGALNGSTLRHVQASVLAWLNQEVWVPNGSCFDRGPDNRGNLPLDHVSWGVLALPSEYRCLLRHAEAQNYLSASRYTIEMFDHEPLQYWKAPPTGVAVTLRVDRHGEGQDLAVTYEVTDRDHDFLLWERDREVDLRAMPGFTLAFWLKGEGQGRQFVDVKLRNRDTGEVYWKPPFLADFEGWRRIEVPYEQFELFSAGSGKPLPLGRVDKIQFGLNTNHQVVEGELSLGRIEYWNHAEPFRPPVEGFRAFQSEQNWLFLEGTAAMAAAYCVSGDGASSGRHLATLGSLARRADGSSSAWGLPSWFTGGWERPEPNALGTGWLLMALYCVDPFGDPL